MDSPKQDEPPHSLESSPGTSTRSRTPPSSCLTATSTWTTGTTVPLPGPAAPSEDDFESLVSTSVSTSQNSSSPDLLPQILEPREASPPSASQLSEYPTHHASNYPDPLLMSAYSATSAGSEYSEYSNPPARHYRLPSFQNMSGSRRVSLVRDTLLFSLISSSQMNSQRLGREESDAPIPAIPSRQHAGRTPSNRKGIGHVRISRCQRANDSSL